MSEAAIRVGFMSKSVEVQEDGDLALVARLRQGDAAAMQELVRRFGPQLNRLVGRLTAWSSDCEDILQEVFLTAWQHAGSFRGDGSLEGWLRRLAINQCLNHRRARNAFDRLLARLAGRKSASDCESVAPSEHGHRVREALAKLRNDDRTVLVLYYLEELNGSEVAELLGIRLDTFHVRLHRARQRLRKHLEKE